MGSSERLSGSLFQSTRLVDRVSELGSFSHFRTMQVINANLLDQAQGTLNLKTAFTPSDLA
jgi:hypothetical protein